MRLSKLKQTNKEPHILVFFEQHMPTTQSLCTFLLRFAELCGGVVRIMRSRDMHISDLAWSDIIVCIRGQSGLEEAIMRIAKEANRFCIVFWDDDLFDPDEGYGMLAHRRKALRNILAQADIIWGCNELLAKKLAAHVAGGRYAISNTAVRETDLVRIGAEGMERKKIKLVYAAGSKHTVFFNRYILPIMPQLCAQYGDMVSLWFIGVRPELTCYEKLMEIHYIEGMPLETYRQHMRASNYDIGLAPLTEGGMRQYKYFNKFIEYTMMGILGVYSDCDPYTLVVRDGINGFLCKNKPDDWLFKLSEAIENKPKRRYCVENAQKQLLHDFNENKICLGLITDIPELTTYHAPAYECPGWWFDKLCYHLYRMYELPMLGLKHLVAHGLRSTWHAVIQRHKLHNSLKTIRYSEQNKI